MLEYDENGDVILNDGACWEWGKRVLDAAIAKAMGKTTDAMPEIKVEPLHEDVLQKIQNEPPELLERIKAEFKGTQFGDQLEIIDNALAPEEGDE